MSIDGAGLTIADKNLFETTNKVNSGELDMVGVKNFYDIWAEKYDQVNLTKIMITFCRCCMRCTCVFYFQINDKIFLNKKNAQRRKRKMYQAKI